MNKAQMMTKLVDMLATLSSMSYEKLFDQEEHEQPILDMFEDLIDQLRAAHEELPRTDQTNWTVEREFPMELMVTVKAHLVKKEPTTRHYPGSPAHYDDVLIEIEGCGVTQELFNKLTETYEHELDEQIWDEVKAKEEDYLEAEAEAKQEAADARRDILEDR